MPKSSDQEIINGLLWRITMNQGGEIVLPYIAKMPPLAGLKIDNIPGTDKVKIRAVINSRIATPIKRIITLDRN
jgi:hypothetical protein